VANHAETPITLTDAPDDLERAGIMDGLRDYNEAQAGGSDACPLAILVRDPEAEIAERAARFIKAELKRADITYEELAERLKEHGLSETRDSIAAKLKRGTFAATFFLAVMAAIGRERINLADV
jgi:Domain of unknown function (DUF6471)